jgi:hypothetical protein
VLHLAQGRGGVPPSALVDRVVVRAALLVAALLLCALLATLLALPALGQDASPAPTLTPGILPPTDPRSEGQGPGLDGGPLMAAALVVGLGLLAALGTLAYLRLARH